MSAIQPQQYQRLRPISGFNSLHITRLAVKVDGITEHLFIAILNGEAVGQVIAKIRDCKACEVHTLFVTPRCRHMNIATRLVKDVEVFAVQEKASTLEIEVHAATSQPDNSGFTAANSSMTTAGKLRDRGALNM